MINQNAKLTELKGVGDKTAQLLAKKGLCTVGDMLTYYPRDYDWFEDPVKVAELKAGKVAAVVLTILGNGSTVHAGGYRITTFRAADATGQMRLTYFNMPYLQKTIQPGSIHVFRGLVRQQKNGAIILQQPAVYTPAEYEKLQSTFQPRYPLSQGLKNGQIIKLMTKILEQFSFGDDYLPAADRERLGLYDEEKATRLIHFPGSREELIKARNRKVFDEFFAFLIAVKKEKAAETRWQNTRPMIEMAETRRLIECLPYELTDGQKKAWQEIESDLTGPYVMNRLLQGDVGSGKTILAFLSLLLCACNGRQGAMMAPTEVLAQQHMEGLEELIREYHLPLHPLLLTGSVKGRQRKEAYAAIADGSANVILGTHALIQEAVEYKDLGLVITDEQHRFGVRQRESLAGKGEEVPVLVMSATPIPRTLAIILYGDLQVSQLTELPKNRLPIKNLAIDAGARGRVFKFMAKQIAEGRQAYIICPAVEESEAEGMADLENVRDYTEKIRKVFPPAIRIASLNGRMKPAEKNHIMDEFSAHNIDILVSTTVIEVGINVPNATVILIENAERFGLSQLHQLRGRVGRGKWQSYCVFLYSETLEKKPKRLEILEKSNDGFYIAEEDLKLRGPGDMFGVRQSGELGFRVADIYEDAGTLQKAAAYADEVLQKNPDYELPGRRQLDLRSI